MSNFDISSASFNENLRMLETSDPVHASTFNALFGQLIRNDVALKDAAGGFASTKNEQALFLLNLHKDGKKYGVHFDDYSVSPASTGTRLYDAVGMTAAPSTNTIRGVNDFDGNGPFAYIEVNGSVDTDGEFQITYIKGIDPEFSREDYDTYCLYLTQYWKYEILATGENFILSDTKHDSTWIPEGAAIRTDGTIRSFVAIAKYMAADGADGFTASISGKIPNYNQSYSGLITKMHAKGNQYCATTAQDKAHLDNMFLVAFATRNSQSIMTGATSSYYLRYFAQVVESNVERIIIKTSEAKNLLVGSTVSIGNATALSGSNPTDDRNNAGNYTKANRVKITKIEQYDDTNSAVYVDNGGATFSTGSTDITGTEVKTSIMTYPWYTGWCDEVLGSCGSPISCTSGKEPYLLFGVEMAGGQYEVIGNSFLSIEDHQMYAYICYDCTKLATTATTDYEKVSYALANCNASWKYISKLGFDPDNPCVRHGTEVLASSSNGYADGQYTEELSTTSNGYREWLSLGGLTFGASAGRWCALLNGSLGSSDWPCASRLSASGRCAQSAS